MYLFGNLSYRYIKTDILEYCTIVKRKLTVTKIIILRNKPQRKHYYYWSEIAGSLETT